MPARGWHSRAAALGLVAAALAALATPSLAYESCENSCGKPPQTQDSFCTHIDWSVCRTGAEWTLQDDTARSRFLDVINGTSVATGSQPVPVRAACVEAVKHAVCLEMFPACEVAHEVKRLCADSCENLQLTTCKALPSEALSLICPDDLVTDSNTCFKLDYSGPSVGLWLAGLLISVIFSFLAALGINLQKYSLRANDNATRKRPPYKQPYWLIGFTLIVLGSILDFVAFGLAPQTFLAPLAALSLVWNMMLAPRFHDNERITRHHVVSTVVIGIGVTSTVIFSAHATPTYVLDDLIYLAEQPVMMAYGVLVGSALVIMYVGARTIEASGREGSLLHIICYGGLGGTFGGQSVLLAKSTVELVKSAIWAGGNAFSRVPTYFIAAAMACTLLLQLHFLNEGLRRFDALLMVPVYQAFWIMMSIIGGMMFFEEYAAFEATDWVMFFIGSGVTIGGIMLLLRVKHEPAAPAGSPSGAGVATSSGRGGGRSGGRGGTDLKYSQLRAESEDVEDPDVLPNIELRRNHAHSSGSDSDDEGGRRGRVGTAGRVAVEMVVGDTGSTHLTRQRAPSADGSRSSNGSHSARSSLELDDS